MNDNQLDQRARRFYLHLIVYAVVNAVLFTIDMVRSPEHLWFYWVALIWGTCLLLRGLYVFRVFGLFGLDWEKRKVDAIVEKEARKDRARAG